MQTKNKEQQKMGINAQHAMAYVQTSVNKSEGTDQHLSRKENVQRELRDIIVCSKYATTHMRSEWELDVMTVMIHNLQCLLSVND